MNYWLTLALVGVICSALTWSFCRWRYREGYRELKRREKNVKEMEDRQKPV